MTRFVLILSLAAASLAAKDRAWLTGQMLDKTLNPYLKAVDSGSGDPKAGADTNVNLAISNHLQRYWEARWMKGTI